MRGDLGEEGRERGLPPLLALVFPLFFRARFGSSPTTESLEQANTTPINTEYTIVYNVFNTLL